MRTERILSTLPYLCAVLLSVALAPARAQQPSGQVIRIVVPFAPGGSADVTARAAAARLSERLGRSVIVENRTGASGQIGLQSVVKAKNDGTTLLVTPSGPISISAHMQKLPYDPVTDLTPVAMLARVPAGIAVPTGSPYRSLGELVNAGKASPKGITYGVGLLGGHMHLVGQLLAARTGMQLNAIPYRGNSQSVVAAVSGDVDSVISDMTTLMPLVKGGRLRLLAVTDSKRASVAPEVPTVDELGFPNSSADAWIGMFGPAGLPAEFVEQVNSEIARMLGTQEMRALLVNAGLDSFAMSPAEMKRFLTDDYARWGRIIKERNIKAE